MSYSQLDDDYGEVSTPGSGGSGGKRGLKFLTSKFEGPSILKGMSVKNNSSSSPQAGTVTPSIPVSPSNDHPNLEALQSPSDYKPANQNQTQHKLCKPNSKTFDHHTNPQAPSEYNPSFQSPSEQNIYTRSLSSGPATGHIQTGGQSATRCDNDSQSEPRYEPCVQSESEYAYIAAPDPKRLSALGRQAMPSIVGPMTSREELTPMTSLAARSMTSAAGKQPTSPIFGRMTARRVNEPAEKELSGQSDALSRRDSMTRTNSLDFISSRSGSALPLYLVSPLQLSPQSLDLSQPHVLHSNSSPLPDSQSQPPPLPPRASRSLTLPSPARQNLEQRGHLDTGLPKVPPRHKATRGDNFSETSSSNATRACGKSTARQFSAPVAGRDVVIAKHDATMPFCSVNTATDNCGINDENWEKSFVGLQDLAQQSDDVDSLYVDEISALSWKMGCDSNVTRSPFAENLADFVGSRSELDMSDSNSQVVGDFSALRNIDFNSLHSAPREIIQNTYSNQFSAQRPAPEKQHDTIWRSIGNDVTIIQSMADEHKAAGGTGWRGNDNNNDAIAVQTKTDSQRDVIVCDSTGRCYRRLPAGPLPIAGSQGEIPPHVKPPKPYSLIVLTVEAMIERLKTANIKI